VNFCDQTKERYSMKKIKARFGKRSYEIVCGEGALSELPSIISGISKKCPVVVITDRNVIAGSGRLLSGVLNKVANPTVKIVLDPGERSKSLRVFENTVKKITLATKGHKPIVVAAGGGVVGDLAGFVAATYRRGVPLVQVPTTLLAQVDSSVGGKVGVDLPEAKNIIGAFYQPRAVLSDTRFLKSLEPRQVRNGLAEVIKYAVIKDPDLYGYLEKNIQKAVSRDSGFMEKIVSVCAGIKAGVVEKDEFDSKDLRIVLNFGHTLGHAVETASGYSDKYNHGESIGLGMLMAGDIGVSLGIFASRDLERMKSLISYAGLPVALERIPVKKVLEACRYDKKFTSGINRFVVPVSIGRVKIVEDVPESFIRGAVKRFSITHGSGKRKKR
jgi:3-dehydroquinate synthase